ncbi:hypothetical protein NFI96_007206 [Prochilodus magdalenae]|nr:hypothetical protein NFI96_007206 [Prochilodus magdalenae]
MVVAFRRVRGDRAPPNINGSVVEIVQSTKFTKKAQRRLYFLRRLRKAHLPTPILTMFYRETVESIRSSYINA